MGRKMKNRDGLTQTNTSSEKSSLGYFSAQNGAENEKSRWTVSDKRLIRKKFTRMFLCTEWGGKWEITMDCPGQTPHRTNASFEKSSLGHFFAQNGAGNEKSRWTVWKIFYKFNNCVEKNFRLVTVNPANKVEWKGEIFKWFSIDESDEKRMGRWRTNDQRRGRVEIWPEENGRAHDAHLPSGHSPNILPWE